jgi:hypothetical protein
MSRLSRILIRVRDLELARSFYGPKGIGLFVAASTNEWLLFSSVTDMIENRSLRHQQTHTQQTQQQTQTHQPQQQQTQQQTQTNHQPQQQTLLHLEKIDKQEKHMKHQEKLGNNSILLHVHQTFDEAELSYGFSPALCFDVRDAAILVPKLISLGAKMDGAIDFGPRATVVSLRSPDGAMVTLIEQIEDKKV